MKKYLMSTVEVKVQQPDETDSSLTFMTFQKTTDVKGSYKAWS